MIGRIGDRRRVFLAVSILTISVHAIQKNEEPKKQPLAEKRNDKNQKRGLYGIEPASLLNAPPLPPFAAVTTAAPLLYEASSLGPLPKSISPHPELIIKSSSTPFPIPHEDYQPALLPAVSPAPLPPHGHVKEITVTKEVPVPYLVHVEKKVPYPVYIQVPHPYPVTVEKHVPYEVRVPVEHPVPVPVPKPYPVAVEKRVPYPVKVPVDRPYPVHIPVEKPIPYAVEKPVPYPVHVLVDRPVAVPKPYPVAVEKHIPYPVEKPVPYPVKVPVAVEKHYEYPVHEPVKPYYHYHKYSPYHYAY